MSSMVWMRKIIRQNGFIEATYTPEHSTEEGYVKIRISDGEVVSKALTSLDGKVGLYFGHVKNALLDLANEDDLPEERCVMWY